jgi:hypothetical protein
MFPDIEAEHVSRRRKHSFKNRTSDRTGEVLGSRFTGPTAGPLGSIAEPAIEKLLLLFVI